MTTMELVLDRIEQQAKQIEKSIFLVKEIKLNQRNDNDNTEIWKHYKAFFYVSSYGRVYCDKGNGKILSASMNSRGYYSIGIQKKTITIHKLVAHCFHGPRPQGMVIDHINQTKTDNRANNLRYVTPSFNNLNRQVKGSVRPTVRKNGNIYYRVSYPILNADNSVTIHQKGFTNNRDAAEEYLRHLQTQYAR
jgi:hypothetical protein